MTAPAPPSPRCTSSASACTHSIIVYSKQFCVQPTECHKELVSKSLTTAHSLSLPPCAPHSPWAPTGRSGSCPCCPSRSPPPCPPCWAPGHWGKFPEFVMSTSRHGRLHTWGCQGFMRHGDGYLGTHAIGTEQGKPGQPQAAPGQHTPATHISSTPPVAPCSLQRMMRTSPHPPPS